MLTHLMLYDSVAQATTQATGVKYLRIVKSALERMAYIASYDEANTGTLEMLTEREQKITKAIVTQFDNENGRKLREF